MTAPLREIWRVARLKIAGSIADGTKLAAGPQGESGGEGYVYTSADSGAMWTKHTVGNKGTWFVAITANDNRLLAANHRGYIYVSEYPWDVWTPLMGAGKHTWYSIAASADGTVMTAGTYGDYVYTSTSSRPTSSWSS